MPTPTELLRAMNADHFHEVLSASPRAFREELFRRAGVRVKGGAFSVKSVNKNRARANKLLEMLCNGLDLGTDVLEEVIRNYLYTRRPLLAEALDALEVEHDQGLTDADLDFIGDLPEERGKALRAQLVGNHAEADVDLYLAFMNMPGC